MHVCKYVNDSPLWVFCFTLVGDFEQFLKQQLELDKVEVLTINNSCCVCLWCMCMHVCVQFRTHYGYLYPPFVSISPLPLLLLPLTAMSALANRGSFPFFEEERALPDLE